MSKKKKSIDKKEIENSKELKEDLMDLFKLGKTSTEKSEVYQAIENFHSEKDLEQKTDLEKPILWSALSVLQNFYDKLGVKRPSEILETFKFHSFKNLISKKRLGRKEFVECIKGLGISIQQDNLSDIRKKEDIF